MSKSISAIYDNQTLAQQAITVFKGKGIKESDISVLVSKGSKDKSYKIEENSHAKKTI